MKIFVYCKTVELTESLLVQVERAFESALGPFSDQIEEIRVRLSFYPQGSGVHKECRVRVRFHVKEDVAVTNVDRNLDTAVHGAAKRVGEIVSRVLESQPASLADGRNLE